MINNKDASCFGIYGIRLLLHNRGYKLERCMLIKSVSHGCPIFTFCRCTYLWCTVCKKNINFVQSNIPQIENVPPFHQLANTIMVNQFNNINISVGHIHHNCVGAVCVCVMYYMIWYYIMYIYKYIIWNLYYKLYKIYI